MQLRRMLIVILHTGFAASAIGAEGLTYEKDIRPIFREHCFDCHGATDDIKGGLDLRLVRLMEQGGESGPAVVRHEPSESYLLDRIQNGEMPPGEGRMSDAEIKTIEDWIAAGAPTARPEPETIGPGLGITPEERSFWSFQPIRRPEVDPASFPAEARVRTPIDALVWQEEGFAEDADRRVLVIRAYLDLVGVPPTPEQMQQWMSDTEDGWYDRLLTSLLESPHYGERWGRHWLDVAGYADSEGYTVADSERQWSWKYRDWVIRALNNDKPFDQFITEQLAGDELAGPISGDLTSEQIELLTATGFLRMSADGTGSGSDNAEARNQVMADTLKIVGTSLLGLSVQCAQCHDHRYDPIPQTDYYALRAVFEPALDWQAWKVPNARRISLYTAADREKAAEIEKEAQQVAAEKTARLNEFMQQALDQELKKYKEPLQTSLRTAYATAAGERTDEQKQLLMQYPSVNITPGNLYQYIPDSRPKLAEFDKQIGEIRSRKPAEEFLRALVEPAGHVPETKLFHRGDHQQPKQTIAPAALTVASPEDNYVTFPVNDDQLPTTGRRLAFARWLTGRDNPLFARIIVNRVWMHHFGQPLVATPADFGKLGTKPSHPELLDWLADEFMTQGWSLKQLHRLIMTSTVWRQQVTNESAFPRKLQRLEAETIRDRMLAVTGQLDSQLYGPPLSIKESDTGQVIVDGTQTRRSLYIQVRRSRPVGMLQTFDAPVMETNCENRSHSTVATQALMLLNGEFILEQSRRLAEQTAVHPEPVAAEVLAALPAVRPPAASQWKYGFGWFDEAANRTAEFHELSHWTGTQWQAGEQLPDAERGWVILHAAGGHPDIAQRAVIRRWVATAAGRVSISGTLAHPTDNGDGVRGRIVHSQTGRIGEWAVHNSSTATQAADIVVAAGDTIDFVTDCRANQTSDSFTWPVTVTLTADKQPEQKFVSSEQFRGPAESVDQIPGRIARAWKLAYCRAPSTAELQLAMQFVAGQVETFEHMPQAVPQGQSAIQQAITNLSQSLLSSNEFLYVE